jgi:hypothetical protein
MLAIVARLSCSQFKFGYRHVLTCQASLVHEETSLENYRVAGGLPSGFIEIARHEISVHNFMEFSVSDNLNRKLLFCALFYFSIATPEQEIVDGCSEPTKPNHQPSKHAQILEDVDSRNAVLKDEERLGHGVEEKLEIPRHLNSVLIFAVEVLSALDFGLIETLPQEGLAAVLIDVFVVGHGKGYWLMIDNFIF